METYEAMRQFADSWGLVGMFAVFLLAVLVAFRPGGKATAEQAAQIPFSDITPASSERSDATGGNSPALARESFRKSKHDRQK